MQPILTPGSSAAKHEGSQYNVSDANQAPEFNSENVSRRGSGDRVKGAPNFLSHSSKGLPLRGGLAKQKLGQRARCLWSAPVKLKSEAQLSSTVKAVYPLEHPCPNSSMAPVLAIT
jgi:hypothetical protein